MWCSLHCKGRIFFAGLTVFLNGWYNVTASEAVKCLSDLMKCVIYWLSCWLTSTDLATVWMTQDVWNWLTLLLYWFFGSVVIHFCWTWLWVLMGGWMPQKLLILSDWLDGIINYSLVNWQLTWWLSEWLRNFQWEWLTLLLDWLCGSVVKRQNE